MGIILEFRRPAEPAATQGTEVKSEEMPCRHSAEIIMLNGNPFKRQPGDGGCDYHAEPSAKRVRNPARRDQ